MSPIEIREASTVALIAESGFNLYSLIVDGFDYMHAEPGFPASGKPTHNGTPVLFPWPNRIAEAQFTWDGVDYELPRNEAATGCSIHGYAVASPWQIIDSGPGHVTGEYTVEGGWPTRGRLRMTYRVEPAALITTCEVENLDDRDFPFGLGFHPYLRVPGPFDQWVLQVDAGQFWPLANMVPTGPPQPVSADLDFRKPKRIGDQHLDARAEDEGFLHLHRRLAAGREQQGQQQPGQEAHARSSAALNIAATSKPVCALISTMQVGLVTLISVR